MLTRPRKRIWPSLICSARSNTRRHAAGLKNGSRPSATSISATRAEQRGPSTRPAPTRYLRAGAAGAAAAAPLPRIALKKSLLGSTTITSDLLRKLAR